MVLSCWASLERPRERVAQKRRCGSSMVAGAWVKSVKSVLLLRFGPPRGMTDVIGVVIIIVQWMLLADALKPRGVPADH